MGAGTVVDKTMVLTSAGALLSRLIAQVPDVTGTDIPGLAPVANLTSTALMAILVVWLITKGLPEKDRASNETIKALVKDFREESAMLRADRERDRERVQCQYDPPGRIQ